MYDQVQVHQYNEHYSSYEAVWTIVKHVRSQQIEFGGILTAGGEDKCAIHIPVYEEDTGAGCGAVPVGTHPSIKSLYDDHAHVVCHVEDGARAIDVELASKVAILSDAFVRDALARGARFVERYEQGAPVEWVRYGRGYCYLQLIRAGVRHRVARILGPFPLLSDVMRFVAVVGEWGDVGHNLVPVGHEFLHVSACAWTPRTSMRGVLFRALGLDDSARVGGTAASKVGSLVGLGDVFLSSGYSAGLLPTTDVRGFLATVSSERMEAATRWIKKHELVGSVDLVANVLIASTALVALQVLGSDGFKQRVRMWQVVGDLVCKQYAAMHVLSVDGSPEMYSQLVGKDRQCNKAMSAAIVNSDFFPVCAAQGLDLQSKAWADMLEGLIGVIAMSQPALVLKRCLVHFGLIPDTNGVFRGRVATLAPELPQLNSGDWLRAAKLLTRENL